MRMAPATSMESCPPPVSFSHTECNYQRPCFSWVKPRTCLTFEHPASRSQPKSGCTDAVPHPPPCCALWLPSSCTCTALVHVLGLRSRVNDWSPCEFQMAMPCVAVRRLQLQILKTWAATYFLKDMPRI